MGNALTRCRRAALLRTGRAGAAPPSYDPRAVPHPHGDSRCIRRHDEASCPTFRSPAAMLEEVHVYRRRVAAHHGRRPSESFSTRNEASWLGCWVVRWFADWLVGNKYIIELVSPLTT